MDNRPIVFDSGLGGLTVLNEINNLLPLESIVYFGDGRAPYGTKSEETVIVHISGHTISLNQDIKMIVLLVIASACSLELVKNNFDIPVVEVVQPGAVAAVNETKTKDWSNSTIATIESGVYEKAIKRLDSAGSLLKGLSIVCSTSGSCCGIMTLHTKIAQEYMKP